MSDSGKNKKGDLDLEEEARLKKAGRFTERVGVRPMPEVGEFPVSC